MTRIASLRISFLQAFRGMGPKEVVITGLGIVSPIGIGEEPFWAALREGRSGVRSLDLPDDPDWAPPIGGAVADFDPKQYVRPRKSLKVMSRDIQLGFAAADLACLGAGLRRGPIAPERLGVVFGAGLISCELEELGGTYRGCMVDGAFDFRRWGAAAQAELFPLWMLKYLPNMPACHIGIGQDARGPNNTITLGDVSTLSALAEAVRIVERHQADLILAGGVDSLIHPAQWMRCQILGLSRCRDPRATPRPFDARRDGRVNGEGAAAFAIETRVSAQARGAAPLAQILGYGAVFAPPVAGQPQPAAIGRAIAAALREAGLGPGDVGLVVAHACGAVEGDRIEAEAIRAALDDVPVTAPKSFFGHLGAASGALETAVAVLSVRHGLVPATLNYEQPDPRCPVNVVRGQPAPLERRIAMILSHSPQGQAVAVVLGAG
jgi:3-oxoacyl-[acyl-carrier-protein] synthase II